MSSYKNSHTKGGSPAHQGKHDSALKSLDRATSHLTSGGGSGSGKGAKPGTPDQGPHEKTRPAAPTHIPLPVKKNDAY